jgi:hypothetical protein
MLARDYQNQPPCINTMHMRQHAQYGNRESYRNGEKLVEKIYFIWTSYAARA